jgi:hypothetical protein
MFWPAPFRPSPDSPPVRAVCAGRSGWPQAFADRLRSLELRPPRLRRSGERSSRAATGDAARAGTRIGSDRIGGGEGQPDRLGHPAGRQGNPAGRRLTGPRRRGRDAATVRSGDVAGHAAGEMLFGTRRYRATACGGRRMPGEKDQVRGHQAGEGRGPAAATWLLFIVPGNASSAGAVARPLLPPYYAFIGRFLRPGATVGILRIP